MNAHSENCRSGRLRREKSQKNNDFEGRKLEMKCWAKRIEAIAISFTFVVQIPKEMILRCRVVFINFHLQNNALCNPWKVHQLQEQEASETSQIYLEI